MSTPRSTAWSRDPLLRSLVGGALLVSVSVALGLAGRGPDGTLPLPWFVPTMDAALVLIAVAITVLALGRWRVLGDPASFWTVVGFSGFGLGALFHFLTFPGVLGPGRAILAATPSASLWANFAANLSLVVSLILSATARAPAGATRVWSRLLAAWPLALVALHLGLVASAADLPVLVEPDGRFTLRVRVGNGLAAALSAAGVLLSARRYLRTRDVLSARVAVCQLLLFHFAVLSVFAAPVRFGVWWYVQVSSWVVGFCAVLLGLLTAYVGLYRSEQERKEELRASEEKFRSVFEKAAIGMARVRLADARCIDVNDACCQMLGRPREELLRTTWTELTRPDDREPGLASFRRMAAGALDSYTVEQRLLRGDGGEVWAQLTLSAVHDAQGRPDYQIAVIADVTERKRAELALREADRRKSEFLGMLSHELRNPLAPIRTSLHVLDRAVPGGPQARRAREVVDRQVAHLTRLVDDLLDVTRVSRGKVELRRTTLDLAALVRRASEDHRALLEGDGVALAVHAPAERIPVHGDEARLAQIVGNLLQNARKFTPAGGRVDVSVAREGGTARLSVRDTGAGIDPEFLPQLFQPFLQGKQTLARSEGGLGLGLALVRGLAELHGGAARAASEGRGRGSEFTVELPLAPAAPDARAAPSRAAGRGRSLRVLVVDDNRDAAESLAELVELFGHEVEIALDGPSAVAQAAAHRPEVILCDIGLPGMDGYQVARSIRAAHDGAVRLVALSGYAQPEDVQRAAEAGFDAHVAKPADPDRLERLLAGPAGRGADAPPAP